MGTHNTFSSQAEITVFSADAIARALVVDSDAGLHARFTPEEQQMAKKLYQCWWVSAEENGFCMSVGTVATVLGLVCLEMARHQTANHSPSPAKES